MENKTIQELLSSLGSLVSDARGSLFGQDKVMVDREQLLYLVDALQSQLPAEIDEARTIIDNCNALRNNAKSDAAETRRQANQVLKEAEERAAKLIEEDNLVVFAKKREQEILEGARQQHDQLIASAVQYADRIMAQAQETVTGTMESLNAGMDVLRGQAKNEMDVSMQKIAEARKALKNAGTEG